MLPKPTPINVVLAEAVQKDQTVEQMVLKLTFSSQ